eukprot:6645178-Pyramimonas_sp.AAC.1
MGRDLAKLHLAQQMGGLEKRSSTQRKPRKQTHVQEAEAHAAQRATQGTKETRTVVNAAARL